MKVSEIQAVRKRTLEEGGDRSSDPCKEDKNGEAEVKKEEKRKKVRKWLAHAYTHGGY